MQRHQAHNLCIVSLSLLLSCTLWGSQRAAASMCSLRSAGSEKQSACVNIFYTPIFPSVYIPARLNSGRRTISCALMLFACRLCQGLMSESNIDLRPMR